VQPNPLYHGDNLDMLRRHVKDDSVDLVYLDPPFKSNVDCNSCSPSTARKRRRRFGDESERIDW
jgi:16S rRNA G966 N2-methylase RsmD